MRKTSALALRKTSALALQKTSALAFAGRAGIFAALGDTTRLRLVTALGEGQALSISELTEGSKLTRQAVTRHLHVLEDAGLVVNLREGRESLFRLEAAPLREMREYLDQVSGQWDDAMLRLKAFVEK